MPAPPAGTDAPAVPDRILAGVRRRLLDWYRTEQRDFPWRRTRDPWAVLVSEVMLQQTQASRVAQRFLPFLARFPTPRAMAEAGDAAVLAAWSGLGYNRRAVALRRTAQSVAGDGWPRTAAELERLPGIGPYTARAVAALAFGVPVGAVDTNVRRWLVRRFGLPVETTPRRLQPLADLLAAPAADADAAAAWMQASMEFGARICSARAPRCGACPIALGCPSRLRPDRVTLRPRPAYPGSRRAARGAILRALAAAPAHRLPAAALARVIAGHDADQLVAALRADGLVHRARGMVRLGPPPTRPRAAPG